MIDYKDKRLEGSALFIQGNSLVSWTVRIGGLLTSKYGFELSKFSHVETIFYNDFDNQLYTVSALQPVVRMKPLKEVIEERSKEFKLIVKLNDKDYEKIKNNRVIFQSAIKKSIGMKYGYFSAITSEIDPIQDGSILDKTWDSLKPQRKIHCSSLDALLMKVVKVFNNKNYYLDYTPDDCYYERIRDFNSIINI